MRIVTIVGARPQFIKAAPLSRALKAAGCIEQIIHTGQHFDESMSDIFFQELSIPKPSFNLGIGGGTHGQNTGRMIEAIENILIKQLPDYVLVYGDTDSTLAGALSAVKLNIPIAHVEAGLRSFNRKMPEEINRILTDQCSSILFTPTETATNNLINEGFKSEQIKEVGDVMYDASIFYSQKAKMPKVQIDADFILCTVHRAENTNAANILKWIFDLLSKISKQTQVVLPLHPRTKKLLDEYDIKTGNILIIDPVSYLEMIWLINNCALVITDSGGLQKEAYFFKKQCITLRKETEWTELVSAGANKLLPPFSDDGYSVVLNSLKDVFNFDPSLYGTGNASEKIVEVMNNLK